MSQQQSSLGNNASASIEEHKRKICRQNLETISAASRLLAARISVVFLEDGRKTTEIGTRNLDSMISSVHTLLSEIQELCRLRLEHGVLQDVAVGNMAMTLFVRMAPVRKKIKRHLVMYEWVRGNIGDAAAIIAMRAIFMLLATNSSLKTLELSLKSVVLELQR